MSKLNQGRNATLRLEPWPWHRVDSCSGLRPTGVLEGATGLPVRLHRGFGYWEPGDYATLARIVTNSSAAVG